VLHSALAEVQARPLDEVRGAVNAEAPTNAMRAVVTALVGFAASQPAMARFLMNESMAGGRPALDQRDQGIVDVAGLIDRAHALAGFLVPSILLSLALLATARSRRARCRYGCVAVITAAALLSTATLAPLVVAVIGALYIAARRRLLHVAVAVLVPALLVGVLIFGASFSGRAEQQYSASASSYRIPLVPQTLAFRYAIFREQTAPALAGRLSTGYGPDLPPQLALGNFPFTETAYVTMLLRGGIPLLVVFLALLLVVARGARSARRGARTDLGWSVATVALYTSVAWLVLQLLESYLLDDGPSQAFWVVVALMLAGGTTRGPGIIQSAKTSD
jgi:hypothetical protein